MERGVGDTGTGKAHQDRMPAPQGVEEATARKGPRGNNGPTPMAAVEVRRMEPRICPKYTSAREAGEVGGMMTAVIKEMEVTEEMAAEA